MFVVLGLFTHIFAPLSFFSFDLILRVLSAQLFFHWHLTSCRIYGVRPSSRFRVDMVSSKLSVHDNNNLYHDFMRRQLSEAMVVPLQVWVSQQAARLPITAFVSNRAASLLASVLATRAVQIPLRRRHQFRTRMCHPTFL